MVSGNMPSLGDAILLNLADPDRDPSGLYCFTPDDADLKGRIVRTGALQVFGIREKSYHEAAASKPSRRIDVVRTLAKQEIKNRFDKYPKARIAVIAFGYEPVTIFDDGNPDDLWPHLDRLTLTNSNGYFREFTFGGQEVQATDWKGTPLKDDDGNPIMEMKGGQGCGGGTNILNGLRRAMDVCRDKPSAVGIHHFILVSDGEDCAADNNIGSWLPALKASGVVLDYIHIGETSLNEGIKKVAIALGGTCVQVVTEEELKEKFIEAAQRLCLPPASV
jgi:hypothetical protein